ncbi:hypothetical protein SAMN05421637_0094 [Demequina mangrovi]|uniref:Uncharacterized protein n=1 Tax=Demequina mangrovi TaxID=1043493 RepID=A0A1H6TP85_9MICO|nr:hypothetical protein SAMN05421637_0094 [Demequina mangrovi]
MVIGTHPRIVATRVRAYPLPCAGAARDVDGDVTW